MPLLSNEGDAMNELLRVENVKKEYRNSRRIKTEALQGISFSLRQGRCLGIVGESGCGKSTLCRLLTGMEQPTSGQVFYKGQLLSRKKTGREIQMVFQNSLDAVNLHLNAYRIVAEPLENFFPMKKKERRIRAEKLMEQVGLSAEDLEKYPQQFSGGQLQRICIARALAASPDLLLLDEPLSSLDVSVQAQLLNLLSDLKKQMNLTCILISHDLEAVYYLADELIVMYRGCMVEQIEDIRLFSKLCHPYTRHLLEAHAYAQAAEEKIEISGFEEETMSGCPYAHRCRQAGELCFRERPGLREIEDGHKAACHYAC